MQVVAHGVTVDVLRHVLCDIARSAALGPVDGAKVAAVRVCAGFVGAVAHGVLCDGASDCLGIIGRVEHQQMPMWRAIVLWFGDSEPINWSGLVLELGADTRPYLRQILLGCAWRALVVIAWIGLHLPAADGAMRVHP